MASNAVKKPPAKRRKANGYKMPGHIPKGEVMKDISNCKWVINTSIGIGGFGEIYSAAKETDRSHNNYVIKVEPSENGPLFCEKTVYLKIGKKEDIEEFMKQNRLKSLGMPRFFGCGTHVYNNTRYRFLILERYGKDLWSIFLEKGRMLPSATVFQVGVQVLDVLEYIHSKSYVHADIKGANLLLGLSKGTENQVYLVDFGLASRYPTEFKPNPKKAHNGTLEYTSRDAHIGVTTRRGDIEILGYNMLQWISSSLPWEKLKNPNDVEAEKRQRMSNSPQFVRSSVKDPACADILSRYFQTLSRLEPLDEPDYGTLKNILQTGAGAKGKLGFSGSPAKSPRKAVKSPAPEKKAKPSKSKPEGSASSEPVGKRTRSNLPKVYYCDDGDSNDEEDDEEDEEDEEDGDDRDLFKITPPKQRKVVKRSWKDAPTIVSCSEVYKKVGLGVNKLK